MFDQQPGNQNIPIRGHLVSFFPRFCCLKKQPERSGICLHRFGFPYFCFVLQWSSPRVIPILYASLQGNDVKSLEISAGNHLLGWNRVRGLSETIDLRTKGPDIPGPLYKIKNFVLLVLQTGVVLVEHLFVFGGFFQIAGSTVSPGDGIQLEQIVPDTLLIVHAITYIIV